MEDTRGNGITMANARLCQKCGGSVHPMGRLNCRTCGYRFTKEERDARIARERQARENAEMLGTAIGVGIVVAIIGGVIYVYSLIFPGQTEEERRAELAELEARTREREEYGLDCLDPFSGDHDGLVRQVKARLRDPGSFEHLNTVTRPVDDAGKNGIMMEFTARNGFGGRNRSIAMAQMSNATCLVDDITIERL